MSILRILLIITWLAPVCYGQWSGNMGVKLLSGVVSTNVCGAGNSFAPQFTADGRSVVFVSHANNLVTNDDLGMNLDVFVRDLVNSNTTLVSVSGLGLGGANDDANYPSVSSNGQFVVFASRASNLVSQDTNEAWDVFLRDVQAGTTRLVSVDATGTSVAMGSGRTAKYPLESSYPIISENGRWVAFQSSANNLVTMADTNLAPDVFIRDVQSNVTYLVSINGARSGSGESKSELAAMTPDGRYVAFTSAATDIVAGADGESEELFVRDMQTGTTRWVSQDVWQFVGWPTRAFAPALSQDGRWIVFKAQSRVEEQGIRVLLYDQQSQTSTVLSSNSLPQTFPSITPEGHYVGFESGGQIYVHDTVTGTNGLVTVDYLGTGPANGRASTPVISRDGSKVAFMFAAIEAGPGVTTNEVGTLDQLYVRDLPRSSIELISVRADGSVVDNGLAPTLPALSADGMLVAFESRDDRLVVGDNNRATDVLIRNLSERKTKLVSRRHADVSANSGTGYVWLDPNCISADGRTVVFSSLDSNFDNGDTNGQQDVWLRKVESNKVQSLLYPLIVTWVAEGSIGPDIILTNSQPNVASGGPFISADGRVATFITYYATNSSRSVSLRELYSQTNQPRSMPIEQFNPSGMTTLESPYFPSPISPNSRYMLVQTQLQPPAIEPYEDPDRWLRDEDIFLMDRSLGVRALVSRRHRTSAGQILQTGNGPSISPSFSPDGKWTVFLSQATDLTTNSLSGTSHQLFAVEMETFARAFTNAAAGPTNLIRLISSTPEGLGLGDSITGAVFSADSRYVAFYGLGSLTAYRHDLYRGTNLLVCTNCLKPTLSGDGRLIAFERRRGTNTVSDVCLKDLDSGEEQVLTMNRLGTMPGNGSSTGPQISPDGRFVVFTSGASDLVANDTNNLPDVFVRDIATGATMLLSQNRHGTGPGNGASRNHVLAADGRTVVFQSFASDLVEGDYNDTADIFVVRLGGPDTDQDGMDDDWEVLYFGKLDRDGSGDFDGDGMSDAHEFAAGTDPTNLGSLLRALIVAAADGNGATLHWPAVPGKRYQVQYKDNLNDEGWSDLAEEVVATTFSGSIYDATYADQRYYRVVIRP